MSKARDVFEESGDSEVWSGDAKGKVFRGLEEAENLLATLPAAQSSRGDNEDDWLEVQANLDAILVSLKQARPQPRTDALTNPAELEPQAEEARRKAINAEEIAEAELQRLRNNVSQGGLRGLTTVLEKFNADGVVNPQKKVTDALLLKTTATQERVNRSEEDLQNAFACIEQIIGNSQGHQAHTGRLQGQVNYLQDRVHQLEYTVEGLYGVVERQGALIAQMQERLDRLEGRSAQQGAQPAQSELQQLQQTHAGRLMGRGGGRTNR